MVIIRVPTLGSGGLSQGLTLLQAQVDSLVGGFTQQATDWRSLAAMMVGGMTYRLGRMGALTAGGGRLASAGIGLGAEVTAFEMTSRSLTSLSGEGRLSSHLWQWEGNGGIRQGLLSSLTTFGTLKVMGHIAQGENILVQHLLQDTGMVLGHQVSGIFGITSQPTGSLAEQFLHAEVTNLQISAGMALGHGLTQGRVQALERGLDFTLPSRKAEETPPLISGLSPAFAVSGRTIDLRSGTPEERKGPPNSFMASGKEDGKLGRPRGPAVPPTYDAPTSFESSVQTSRSKDEIVLIPEEYLDPWERYKVIRHIGAGGFGDVYLVRDKKLHRNVVTKIPRSESYNEVTVERFRQEASIGANLDPHFSAWVLDVVELREEIAQPLLRKEKTVPGQTPLPIVVPIMEYVPGHDLHNLL